MNNKLLRTSLILAFAATAAAQANASTMSVDAGSPIQATLLPEVTVVANSMRPDADATMRVAATRPLSVTLLPTVRVNSGRQEQLATVTLPTVRVVAQIEDTTDTAIAYNGDGATSLPRVDAAAHAPGFRASLMPQ